MEPLKHSFQNEQEEFREKVLAMLFTKDPSKKITLEDAAAELSALLDKYEWFYDVAVEGRCLCVYVTHMGPHTAILPDVFYGYQIKEGFSSYLTCKDKYGAKPMGLSDSIDDYE